MHVKHPKEDAKTRYSHYASSQCYKPAVSKAVTNKELHDELKGCRRTRFMQQKPNQIDKETKQKQTRRQTEKDT